MSSSTQSDNTQYRRAITTITTTKTDTKRQCHDPSHRNAVSAGLNNPLARGISWH